MEPYDLLEVGHHPVKEEWRSVTTTSGALSVMIHGTVWMPVLLASKWAIAMKVIFFVNLLFQRYQIYYYRSHWTARCNIWSGNWTHTAKPGPVCWK